MKQMKKARNVYAGVFLGLGALLALIGMSLGGPVRAVAADESSAPAIQPSIEFNMVRSTAALTGNCLPHAHAEVTVVSQGPVEVMTVDATGLPPNTGFDFFVIQIPNAPFGLALVSGRHPDQWSGRGSRAFRGPLQHRDIRSSAASWRSGSSRRTQSTSVPGCVNEPSDRANPHVPPRLVVWFAPGRSSGRLSRHRNPLQR